MSSLRRELVDSLANLRTWGPIVFIGAGFAAGGTALGGLNGATSVVMASIQLTLSLA